MARKTHKIKNLADIDAVEFGDQLDVAEYENFPTPPVTDKEVESFERRFNAAKKRREKVKTRMNDVVKKKLKTARKKAKKVKA